ncbi:MAG TPA: alpha/beta hydrolase [Polyangiaceae bacterium]|jgi:pimeloyl-ACP methyl ester carboxylesterase
MSARPTELTVAGHRLELAWHGPPPGDAPTIVFLHEGLGSVSAWRDFPERMATATGLGALVYSRWGYGASDPVTLPRPLTYMQDEGLVAFPELLDAAGIGECVLFGHSDGGSIAIVFAGSGLPQAQRIRALVLEAPHVFVEDVSVASIEAFREIYATTDLRDKLARHHGANVDGAFRGWNDAWLDPGFRAWNIEEYLPRVAVPSLVVQGERDAYGTLAQVDAIERGSGAPVTRLVLPGCGHSPHRDDPVGVLEGTVAFLRGLGLYRPR